MKSLKIVHCAHFNESKYGEVYYAMDRKVTNGLIRNGYFVYDFSYREIAKNNRKFGIKRFGIDKMNTNLIETCQNIQPQILLLGHSELIYNKTLLQIKKEHPKIKIAMWWVDWIYNLQNIERRLKIIDSFFITTNPEELKEIIEDKTILSKCHYLPNMCDLSIDIYKAFENKRYQYDLLFIGRYDKEREQLINFIKTNCSHLRLGLFGRDKNSIVLGTNFLEKINSSKIAINFNRSNDISMYSSDRIIQLAANGAMVLSAEIPNMDSVFSENEIVYFNNFHTLKKKTEYYLKNNEKRISIAKNGWEKAHQKYDCTTITKHLINKCLNQ